MFGRVLVLMDRDARSARIVPWVRRLLSPAGRVRLLEVLPPGRAVVLDGHPTVYADQAEDGARAEALARLAAVARRLGQDGFDASVVVHVGDVAAAVPRAVEEWAAEALAVAAEPVGGLRALWRRSVVEHVLATIDVPVLIGRRRGQRAA
jgi:nucleotide-binding universal stress UspA family protein